MTLIIWLTIIFIILPIVVEWHNIKSLYRLFIGEGALIIYKNKNSEIYYVGRYSKFDKQVINYYNYMPNIFIGNPTFRFDKPTGIAVLFPPLWICWYLITWKLKDI